MTSTINRTFGRLSFQGNGASQHSLGKPAAVFPNAIATDSNLIIAVDRQQTQLALALNATDTSMTVADPSAIVAYNLLSIDNEIVKTTGAPSGNVIPISRGFDGTTPAIHLASATVSGFVDAWHHNALVAEIEAIEQTLGANLSAVPSSPFIAAGAYNFAPQTPGGVLNVGTNSITLAPVPQGVNGTNTSHYLYISGGTGTAEAVPITGGSAVAGAASGTVFVTCANAHSGAWTIQTATAGIQEALYVAIAGGSSGTTRPVVLPAANAYLYAPVTFPTRPWFPAFSLIGAGAGAPALIRAQSYPSGDLFYFQQSGSNVGSLYMARFYIYNGGPYNTPVNTGGAAIHIKGNTAGTIVIEDFTIDSGYRGIDIESSGTVTIRNPYILDSAWFSASLPSDSAIYLHDPGATKVPSDIHIIGGCLISNNGNPAAANTTRAGILIEASDGVKIEGVDIIQLQNGVWFEGYSGRQIGVTLISDCIFDSFGSHVIYIQGNLSGIGNISIDHSWISTRADLYPSAASGENIYFDTSATISEVSVTNCYIQASKKAGFRSMATLNGLVLSGNWINDNNSGNVASEPGVYLRAPTSRYLIQGNQILNTGFGHQKYGIVIEPGTTDGVITGNDLRPNETSPLLIEASPTGFVCFNNMGLTDVVASMASAATLLFPYNPIFKVTGTVNVTSVSPLWSGASGSLVTVDGPVTFTAGASIGNTITTVQNQPVFWWSDGTKVYFR